MALGLDFRLALLLLELELGGAHAARQEEQSVLATVLLEGADEYTLKLGEARRKIVPARCGGLGLV